MIVPNNHQTNGKNIADLDLVFLPKIFWPLISAPVLTILNTVVPVYE